MADFSAAGARLRELICRGDGLLLPGAASALTVRIVEDLGFDAAYVTGAGVTNTFLGIPDLGFISLPEIAAHVAAMSDVVDIPLVVDADTGFGNGVSVARTGVLERAGAAAIQPEDQVAPKRCGHFDGQAVVSTQEMVQKIHAATDARRRMRRPHGDQRRTGTAVLPRIYPEFAPNYPRWGIFWSYQILDNRRFTGISCCDLTN
jgi:2-methylisocitrate lyase-like PEP mutase family enzyme